MQSTSYGGCAAGVVVRRNGAVAAEKPEQIVRPVPPRRVALEQLHVDQALEQILSGTGADLRHRRDNRDADVGRVQQVDLPEEPLLPGRRAPGS